MKTLKELNKLAIKNKWKINIMPEFLLQEPLKPEQFIKIIKQRNIEFVQKCSEQITINTNDLPKDSKLIISAFIHHCSSHNEEWIEQKFNISAISNSPEYEIVELIEYKQSLKDYNKKIKKYLKEKEKFKLLKKDYNIWKKLLNEEENNKKTKETEGF